MLQNNLAEDPLDNEEQLQDQLDSLPYLCRFQVPPCALICSRRQCCAACCARGTGPVLVPVVPLRSRV